MARYPNRSRFKGEMPLMKFYGGYPARCDIQYHEFAEPKEFDLWEAYDAKKIELGDRKIVFGIKAKPEEFTTYDFLWCPDGPAFVVHNRVLEIFNRLCPDDFQALPMVIKNLNLKDEAFENKEFWLINPLKLRACIAKKTITYDDMNVPDAYNPQFVEGSMKDCLLCRDEELNDIFFHPSLAKHFIKSKGIKFYTAEEASY